MVVVVVMVVVVRVTVDRRPRLWCRDRCRSVEREIETGCMHDMYDMSVACVFAHIVVLLL